MSEIEFNSIRMQGVTLADLERLYGSYRVLPAAKEGTTVIFETSSAATYVAAVLQAAQGSASAPVSALVLRYPR